jgi:hypothetical protein
MSSLDEVEEARYAVIHNSDNEELRRKFASILRRRGEIDHAAFVEFQLDEDSDANFAFNDELYGFGSEDPRHLEWSGLKGIPLPLDVRWEFRKGFAEHLICSAASFIAYGAEVASRTPVRHVTLTQISRNDLPLLLCDNVFRELRSIKMDYCELDDAAVDLIASVEWPRLGWLSLAYNAITMAGVQSMADATEDGRLPKLRFLSLLGCESDPREVLSFDQGAWVGSYLPNDGVSLLADHQEGECIRWLFLTHHGKPRDINRFRLVECQAAYKERMCDRAAMARVAHSAYEPS